METTKYVDVFNKVDGKHIINKFDYIPNAGLPFKFDDNFHICFYGKSRSGKSNAISKLLQHHYVHQIEPKNIYIFSPSF